MTGFVEIGSIDWEHEQWVDKYYPEDLPSDWLFSYFSKQFKTVCLSPGWLMAQAVEDVESWLEDCDSGFEFLLELPEQFEGELYDKWHKLSSLLESQALGYLLTVTKSMTADELSQRLPEMINTLVRDSDRQIFLLPEVGCSLSLNTLKDLAPQDKLQIVANPDTIAQSGNASVAVVDFNSQSDTRALGQFLNAFVNQNSEHVSLYCYFRGDPPSSSLMQAAQSIVSLLDT